MSEQRRIRPLRVCALIVVVLVAGCSGVEDGPVSVKVPCSHAIDAVDDVGPSYATHGSDGGFVALPSGGRLSSGELQLGRMGSTGSELEGYRFAKFGLLARQGRAVSLEVVRSPGVAVLDYGLDPPVRSVRVGPCRSHDAQWVVFAGGMWVTQPGCVELLAASANESVHVPLPAGAPCNGGR